MNNRCTKSKVVLTVLLLSLISISTAVGLKASSDLYSGQCGVELSVPAPGILKNDAQNPSLLQVVNPGSIAINPKYGTITVNADGSFVYDVPENIGTSAVVTFSYTATDGKTVSNPATVKIAVSCRCHGAAPDVTVCLGTPITRDLLMSEGAGCFGCDSTGVWDLSKIPAQPVAGQTYPYTVSCPGCSVFTGHVTIVGPCTISTEPFTVCTGAEPTADMILDRGSVTCSCDTAPVISNIIQVGDHWEYTITCQSVCGPKTETGRVNIEPPCVPTSEPFTVCEGMVPDSDLILANGDVSCGSDEGVCDTTPVVSNIIRVDDHWVYTITCTTALGCISTGTGTVNIETPCAPTSEPFCSAESPTVDQILDEGSVTCGGVCDATPVISDIHEVGDHWEYTITCTTTLGCTASATGIVNKLCEIPPPVGFTIGSDICPDHNLPTSAEILELGAVSCGPCDATPLISNIQWVDTPPYPDDWVGTYDITCASSSCPASDAGEFISPACEPTCACAPVAPNLCGCTESPTFPLQEFLDKGGSCGSSPECDVTITMDNIDDSEVEYSVPNDSKGITAPQYYTYTVHCNNGCTNSDIEGHIFIALPRDGKCEFACCG